GVPGEAAAIEAASAAAEDLAGRPAGAMGAAAAEYEEVTAEVEHLKGDAVETVKPAAEIEHLETAAEELADKPAEVAEAAKAEYAAAAEVEHVEAAAEELAAEPAAL